MNLLHTVILIFALNVFEVPTCIFGSPIACSSNDGPFCPVINGLEKRSHRESRQEQGQTFLEKIESILENIFAKGDMFSSVQDVANALENEDLQIDMSDDEVGEDYNSEDIQQLLKRLGIKGSQDEIFSKEGKLKVKVIRIGKKAKSPTEEIGGSTVPANEINDESELQEDGILISDDSDDLESNEDTWSADADVDAEADADADANYPTDEGVSELADLLDASTEQVAAALEDAMENPGAYQEELRNQFYELTKDNTDEENEAVIDYYRVAIEGITGGDEDIRKSLEKQLRDLLSGGGRREKRAKEAKERDAKKVGEIAGQVEHQEQKPVQGFNKKTKSLGKTTIDPVTGTISYSNVERIANTPRGRNRRAKIVIKRTKDYPDPVSKFKPEQFKVENKGSQTSPQQRSLGEQVASVEKTVSAKRESVVREGSLPNTIAPSELPRGSNVPNEKSNDDTREQSSLPRRRKSSSRLQAS